MIFKNLTFDGISLKEYGVYISGEAVFDSPTREVEMITIPGRNGSFALDKGRFNNITVTYPAGIYATSETEFAEKVSTLRNLLASRKGYCRLTDEYNPDEFRLGVYKAGLELDPTHYNEAGRFELSFDCKPQRFLFSGEEVFTLGEWGQTETKSGSIVSFEGDETTAIKSLTAQIVPKQSGSGDPSPSNVRPISGYEGVNVTRCGKNLVNPSEIVDGKFMAVSGVESANADRSHSALIRVKPNVSYFMNGYAGDSYFAILALDENKTVISNYYGGASKNDVFVATMPNNARYVYLNFFTTQKSTMAFYEATSNEGYIPYQGTSYPISLGRTVYGGTLEVVSGNGTSEYELYNLRNANPNNITEYTVNNKRGVAINYIMKKISTRAKGWCDTSTVTSETNPNLPQYMWFGVNSRYLFWVGILDVLNMTLEEFKTWLSSNDVQIVRELASPTEIQLTPTEVKTLLGSNNIWADSGDVTVEIGQNPYILVNPTLFDAHPLLKFNSSGNGTITINGQTIELLNAPYGVVEVPYTILKTNASDSIATNTTYYNTGDSFTVTGAKITYTFTMSSPINSGTFPGGEDLAYVPYESSISGSRRVLTVEDYQVSDFVAGTSKTVTKTATFTTTAGGTTYTNTITLTLNYSGAGGLSVSWAITNNGISSLEQKVCNYDNFVIVADSTAYSLRGDIYIDLDIGEAYTDYNNTIMSVNNFVNLGGELPTLDPGATEISTDDSISNVKVTPRWWKV